MVKSHRTREVKIAHDASRPELSASEAARILDGTARSRALGGSEGCGLPGATGDGGSRGCRDLHDLLLPDTEGEENQKLSDLLRSLIYFHEVI